MLSGRGLFDELITRLEESYRLCCIVVRDLETSRIGAPYIYDISSLRVKQEYSEKWEEKRSMEWSGGEWGEGGSLVYKNYFHGLRTKLGVLKVTFVRLHSDNNNHLFK